jgi:colicin import membrane protein
MKTGLTISALVHAALLLWGIVSFTARPLEAAPKGALPVDIVSATEFSQLTKGVKTAEKVLDTPPPVEKIAEPKPTEDAIAKIVNKPEIKTETTPPPPLPEPKPKFDAIAETLKKEEAAKKAADLRKLVQQQKQQQQQQPQPKFDPQMIAALLDKRDPQRTAMTGEAVVPAPPSLGVRTGSEAKLSQSELDAMRARLMQLWNPPAGAQNPQELIVRIRIQLSRDGRLNGPPMVLTSGHGPLFQTARDNAIRALFMGQPFTMLSPATYELWREIEITFDPRDMFRG